MDNQQGSGRVMPPEEVEDFINRMEPLLQKGVFPTVPDRDDVLQEVRVRLVLHPYNPELGMSERTYVIRTVRQVVYRMLHGNHGNPDYRCWHNAVDTGLELDDQQEDPQAQQEFLRVEGRVALQQLPESLGRVAEAICRTGSGRQARQRLGLHHKKYTQLRGRLEELLCTT